MKLLLRTAGALPYIFAIFLNAFVDLGHKIIVQNTIFKIYDGSEQVVLTAIVNSLILLPFILLMAPAGLVSDRYPKNQVMRLAAWAAVVVCFCICACYYLGWFWPAFGLTFLLAVQSAFYSPAKLGYLKALFGKEHLAQANGIAQAVAIIAVLAGTLVFSILFEARYQDSLQTEADILKAIAPLGWLLIINSLLELWMMYCLPKLEQTDHSLTFSWSEFLSGRSTRQGLKPLRQRRVIGLAVLGLAMFWSIGQVMLAAFPAFAKANLNVTNTMVIQGILAASGLGIALGSALASMASKRHIETGLLPIGALGIAVGLSILSSLNTPLAHGWNFFFIGVAGGLFIVPLNALIQFHADEHELGKILAANNWLQNMAMLSFLVLTAGFALAGLKAAYLLQIIAVFAFIVGAYTVYKLPQSLVRFALMFLMSRHYKVHVEGMKNIPEKGGVLLLGNHISWIDWAIIQLACPRPLHFVMINSIYQRWYLRWFFKAMGCIPLEQGENAQKALDQVALLLDQGEAVCLFPEGVISRTGHLAQFREGYLRAARQLKQPCLIVPFYLHGLWGSHLSRAQQKHKNNQQALFSRQLLVAFGEPLDAHIEPQILKQKVADLSTTAWAAYSRHQVGFARQLVKNLWQNAQKPLWCESIGKDKKIYQGREILKDILPLSRSLQELKESDVYCILDGSYQQLKILFALLLAGKNVCVLERHEKLNSIVNNALLIHPEGLDLKESALHKKLRKSSYNTFLLAYPAAKASATLLKLPFNTSKFLPASLLLWLYRLQATGNLRFLTAEQERADFNLPGIALHSLQLAALLNPEADESLLLPLNMQKNLLAKPRLQFFIGQTLALLQGMPIQTYQSLECDSLALAKHCAKRQPSYLALDAEHIEQFITQEKIYPAYLSGLQCVIAMDVVSIETLEKFRAKFACTLLQGFAVPQVGAVLSANIPDALDVRHAQVQIGEKPGSLGMALPGSSVKVLDAQGQELAAGELGNLYYRAAQQLNHEPELVWHKAPYKAYLDEDSFLYIPELLKVKST